MSAIDIGIRILTLLGALGVFLYGMKLMSESLQKVAGNRLRHVLSIMTTNKYTGIFAGFLVTALVQSSSATSVLLVSFVNAGFLSLSGSIAVIMGANIGTTITAWLVALLGFTFSISALALPLIGLSLPLIFAQRGMRRFWGEFILGFALLFIGLQFMKDVFPGLQQSPDLYEFLHLFTDLGGFSMIIFALLGMLVTMIIQSSSATMALTLVLAFSGIIPYDLAAAMVLGENLGTTITANLAATIANVTGKRAARAHFLVNLIGLVWMIFLFRPFLWLIDQLFLVTTNSVIFTTGPQQAGEGMLPLGLAAFHTLFNLVNVAALSFFIPQISRLTSRFVKTGNERIEYNIRLMNTGIVSLSELSMLEARQAIANLGEIVLKMLTEVHQQFIENDDKKFHKIARKIRKRENVIDVTRGRINEFLTSLSAEELSQLGSRRVTAMKTIADNLESIGDRCLQLSYTLSSKKEKKIWFSQDQRERLNSLFELVTQALVLMKDNLGRDYDKVESTKAIEKEQALNVLGTELIAKHLEEMRTDTYRVDAGGYYREMISILERLGNRIVNVTESIVAARTGEKKSKN